jgi:hypothetical protein
MIDGVASAKLKVIRAHKHFDRINGCIETYCRRRPYEILTQPDGAEKVHIIETPPADVSILAGECLYAIRSALDHLVFDLIKSNPTNAVLPDGWEATCEFPIFFKLPKEVQSPPLPKRYFTSKCPGLSDTAHTIIEKAQPYYQGNRFGFLHTLSGLSNIDKHRYLNTTVAIVQRQETLTTANGKSSLLIQSGLDHGASLEPLSNFPDVMAEVVKVERQLSVSVAFDEPTVTPPGIVPSPIYDTLKTLLQHLEFFWLPTLDSLRKIP